MVTEAGFVVTAAAALAVLRNERADNIFRRIGGVTALEAEPDQIHSQQAFARHGLARKNRLVADHDAMLVGAHFRTPHPERSAQDSGVGLLNLGDVDPRAAQHRAGRMRTRRHPAQDLRFIGIAIAVLAEQHTAGPDYDKRVTHTARLAHAAALEPSRARLRAAAPDCGPGAAAAASGQPEKACIPVCARPRIRAWISCVPS